MKQTKLVILIAALVVLAAALLPAQEEYARATFAGGCFWCMEKPFDELDGVISTTSGYTGGRTENPTYREVTRGGTGHLEAVQVVYDPEKVDYETLLFVFWRNIDPLDAGGQFCDRGGSYETAVFAHDEEQRRLAEKSKQEARRTLGSRIVTPIRSSDDFYPAEDYHQDYYQKNPVRYNFYRTSCGRDARLEMLWADEAGGYETVNEMKGM